MSEAVPPIRKDALREPELKFLVATLARSVAACTPANTRMKLNTIKQKLNTIKQTLNNGGVSIGTFMFEFNTPSIPGRFDHPDFQAALQTVLDACRHHRIPGFLVSDLAGGKKLLDQGFRVLACGGDLWAVSGRCS